MYKYQISRVLEVFDGSSFEGIINLGMGVYLKKKVYLSGIHSPSPSSLDEREKKYGLNAKNKLHYFIRKYPVYLEVDEYHDDYVYGKIYTDDFYDSINHIMFLKGYVWEKEDNKSYNLLVLSTPK
jgi:endonuclease YncB( thermonuclease family)